MLAQQDQEIARLTKLFEESQSEKAERIARIEITKAQKNGTLAGRDLSGMNLQGFTFEATKLAGVNFEGADLRDTTFFSVDFKEANFRGARFENTRMRYVSFTRIDFRGFNFEGMSFEVMPFISREDRGMGICSSPFIECKFDAQAIRDIANLLGKNTISISGMDEKTQRLFEEFARSQESTPFRIS
jgi:hypothetical protein